MSSGQLQQAVSTRFEVLPLNDTAALFDHLPAGTTVTVTASPRRGLEPTLELSGRLQSAGYRAVPHIAARSVSSTGHLVDVLDQLTAHRISEVFVVGGDSTAPAGPFPDALSLLRAAEELGRLPERIGITGYPEPHALIPDDSTVQAMAQKSRYAHYIVSQMCFSAETITNWVTAVRQRGIQLPIYLGMPGVVDMRKLMRIALRIGLGESTRYLRKQHGILSKLVNRYSADDLLAQLYPFANDPANGIAGWHFFTFNEVARTADWFQEFTTRHGEVSA